MSDTVDRVSAAQQPTEDYDFRVVRRGYDRTAVDRFAHAAHAEITELRQRYETLATHYRQLQQQLQAPAVADYSGLGSRAQEILRMAEEQAHDLTAGASADADRLLEQTEHEVQLLRDQSAAELDERRETELARIDSLSRQAEQAAAVLLGSARTEADQLLMAARLETDAVQAEAEHNARAGMETAELHASALLAKAEQAGLTLRQQAADQRDEVLRALQVEAEDLRTRIEQTMAESSRLHRDSAEHLAREADEAARLRAAALAEVEEIRQAALAEAEAVLDRARQHAVTIEERSRQEFAWRRRQLRQEQDLLTRRKQALLSQLAALSALAIETAESLPEVPEVALPGYEDDPDASTGSPALASVSEPDDQAADDEVDEVQDLVAENHHSVAADDQSHDSVAETTGARQVAVEEPDEESEPEVRSA